MSPEKNTPSIADQVAAIVPVEPEGSPPVEAEDAGKAEMEPTDSHQFNNKGPAANKTLPPEVQQAAATGTLDPEVARVIAEMQTTIGNLEERLTKNEQSKEGEIAEGGASGYPWQYYSKPNTGPQALWVIAGPGGAAKGGQRDGGTFSQYQSRGHKALMNYGPAPIPSDAPLAGQQFWSFIEKGGAKEFPASQVLAYRWHREPPVVGFTFPQYEKIKDTVLEFACDDCDLELSFLPGDELAPRACFNHLRNIHDYPRGEAKVAMDAQGIKNVAPYAIRAEAKELADDRLKVAADA